jgi:hypothetical protein
MAIAPSAPASRDSAPSLAQTPKPAAPSAAAQAIRSDGLPVAIPPPRPASIDSTPLERPKPSAAQTASVPDDSAEPSTPKIDSKRKPPEKPSVQKPLKSAKASTKPVVQAERQSTGPAQPKEAETSPQPGQDTGNPIAAAPVAKPSVQQRVADGVTHAFGYLVHLPGALIPHFGGPSADAH